MQHFFDAQNDLKLAVKELIQNVDLTEYPDLHQTCQALIESCIHLNWRGAISMWESDQGGKEMLKRMITATDGEPQMLFSNAINSFVALYLMVKQNIRHLHQYESEVATALQS